MLTGAGSAFAAPYPPLSAIVTLNGATFTYSETQGTDLGNFTSPVSGFIQRCVVSTVAGSPLRVYYRPDLTSARA